MTRDDLGALHGLAGGRVEAGHVVDDVAVPDDGEHHRRHVEANVKSPPD